MMQVLCGVLEQCSGNSSLRYFHRILSYFLQHMNCEDIFWQGPSTSNLIRLYQVGLYLWTRPGGLAGHTALSTASRQRQKKGKRDADESLVTGRDIKAFDWKEEFKK